jgi:hypothetical protein
MTSACEYCSSSIVEGEIKCPSYGAPVSPQHSVLPDFRVCPFCRRKLLALGSPACNYCGRRLPDEYIKAREGDLKRLTEVKEGEESEVGRKVDELIRQTVRRKRDRSSSPLGKLDITRLIDLFR